MLRAGGRLRRTALMTVVAALGLTGCDAGPHGLNEPGTPARTLTVSTAYLQAHPDDAPQRTSELQGVIADLRDRTASGWTGRQDDLTGYLAELTGGRWFPTTDPTDPEAAATDLMDTYGALLFGITARDLDLLPLTDPLDNDTAALRATQHVGTVPVLDATLVFTIGASSTEPRVNAVRGRVYPDLDLDTTPTLTPQRATKIALRTSGGGTAQRDPRLVVLPDGPGRLTWEIPVTGVLQDGTGGSLAGSVFYISAHTGRLISQRPAGAELAPLHPVRSRLAGSKVRVAPFPGPAQALPDPSDGAVELTGTGPTGEALSGYGVRTPDGIALHDPTVPGGIDVFDMQGSTEDSRLPGRRYVEQGTRVRDPDAIAALAYTRIVHDYFRETHGRSGWDGLDHPMTSSIHFGDGTECNAYFSLYSAQMIYANPCEGPGGLGQMVTLDVTGHEVTHGISGTTAGLVYFGQPGALNESFSDYFGNVIGDLHEGRDSDYLSEDLCSGVTQPQRLCEPMPDGTLALRNLLNGSTFEDYLKVLTPSTHLQALAGYDNDNGGVHLNSAIWNNALWSVRTQVAALDGVPAVRSPRAALLDRAVFVALTTRLTPQASFLDARNAVLESLTGLEAGPEMVRIATQTFDLAGICAGCADTVVTPGVGLDGQPGRQVSPGVSGDLVTWLDIDDAGIRGTATSAHADGTGHDAGATSTALATAFAGEAVVVVDGEANQVVRYAAEGATVLDSGINVFDTAARGVPGGEDGAAWVSTASGRLCHVDPQGTVSTTPLAGFGAEVYSLGTGGGSVVVGTEDGRLFSWNPGTDPRPIGQVPEPPLAVAVHGERALVVTQGGQAVLFEGDRSRQLSDRAVPFGAAVSAEHAVWSEAVGMLDGLLAQEIAGSGLAVDTDLFGYSFGTGRIYDLLPLPGQQGYPALSGRRIVWQDTVYGGDHVFTATLPEGL